MTIQDREVAALIKAGVFRSKKEAVTEALRLMLAARPQLRLEAAVQLFKDATVTLGRAAELAGLTRWEFEAILADRGIERVVMCDPTENLERQVESLRQRE
jgi:predicted HTH domain antitoxin